MMPDTILVTVIVIKLQCIRLSVHAVTTMTVSAPYLYWSCVPVWEPYGRQMGPFGRCVCRMEAMCTGLEPYGSQIPPFGRRMAPCGSHICQYGSHMHKTGAASAAWESDGTMWELPVTYEDHMRAVCTVWVLCAPYWRQMVPYALFGGHVGAMCTMLEPCVPYGSHVGARWCHLGGKWHHMGAA
jgi:hypothetical protein